MKDDNEIEAQLKKFGEVVRSATKQKHKLTSRQIDFFKTAIREQGSQKQAKDHDATKLVQQTLSKQQANTNQQEQSNQKSKDLGHSH